MGATARFAWRMVAGPWAPHSPLVGVGIDALTVTTVASGAAGSRKRRRGGKAAQGPLEVTEEIGRGVEVIVRAVSNLDERLHQSFWLYLMPDPHTFVSVGTSWRVVGGGQPTRRCDVGCSSALSA